MADKQISDLTSAATLDGTELVHVKSGANSRKSTIAAVRTWNLLDATGAVITSGSTWTWSTNVASIAVTGLGGWNELMVFMRGTTCASGSPFRGLQFSADNGSTYYTTSGNYKNVSNGGTESNDTQFTMGVTGTTSALSALVHIPVWNQALIKPCQGRQDQNCTIFDVATALNALKLMNNAAVNFTAGSLFVYGR